MVDAFQLSQRRVAWWILLLEGIAALILGIFLLFSPVKTITTIIFFLGFYLIAEGFISLIDAFIFPGPRVWKVVASIMGLLAGFIIVRNPLWSAFLIPSTAIVYLAILGLIYGLAQIIAGFRGRGPGAIATGVISIIFNVILFLTFPLFVVALPFVLGFCGLIGGILIIILALRIRTQQNKIAQPSF